MSLATGECLICSRWTPLLMPCEAQSRVNRFGSNQKMPKTLTFGDQHGREIQDNLDEAGEWSDDDDDTYEFQDNVDDDELSYDTTDDGAYNTAEDVTPNNPLIKELDHDDTSIINPSTSEDPHDHKTTGVEESPPVADTVASTGVEEDPHDTASQSAGVEEDPHDAASIDLSMECDSTEEADYERAKQLGIKSAQDDGTPLPKQTQKKKPDEMYEYYNAMFTGIDFEHVFSSFDEGDSNDMFNFLTEQMSANAGLKEFGEQGAALIMKELEQLLYRKVIVGHKASSLSSSQCKAALQYLMFLKEKRCGKVKAWGCADGCKQRLYKSKDETSSPTMNVEALFITCLIDAMEGSEVMTCDIPGAFMQSDMDELLHMKLEGEIALLLI